MARVVHQAAHLVGDRREHVDGKVDQRRLEDRELLAAEFSFHYANNKEAFSPKAARRALAFYNRLQTLGWCAPQAQTKTQFIYGQLE